MTQHGKPQRALSSIGFEVSILPVIPGTTGGVFSSSLDSFRAIAIPHEGALHLVNKLPKHAVDDLQTRLDMRRLRQQNLIS